MKLDDNWRKSLKSFLHFCATNIQDMEGIENKLVDDETKHIWLKNTLSYQSDMDATIRQATSTEITDNGTKISPLAAYIP